MQDNESVTGRILVVDDGPEQSLLIGKILSYFGHTVRTASNEIEALACLEEFNPRIVMLDVGMPGMDGYELARRIRQRPGFTRTAIVAVTGFGQESDKELARPAGINRHLLKPVSVAQVSSLVAELLGRADPPSIG